MRRFVSILPFLVIIVVTEQRPVRADDLAYASLSSGAFGIQNLTTGAFTQLGNNAGFCCDGLGAGRCVVRRWRRHSI
jgi:hypothetical protein